MHAAPRALLAAALAVAIGGPAAAHQTPAPRPAPLAASAAQAHAHDSREEPGAAASSGHAHSVPTLLGWLGRLHTSAVHFPIALLIVAACFELLFQATRQESFRHGTRLAVWAGALGALVAAPLGWLFAGAFADDDWLLRAHRLAGTAVVPVAGLVLLLGERFYRHQRGGASFRLVLLACALLVGVVGFLGGALVHGIDHLAWEPR